MMPVTKGGIDAAIEIGAAIIKVVIEAFSRNDVAKMKRVMDILPPEHPLKSRAALLIEEEKARKTFA